MSCKNSRWNRKLSMQNRCLKCGFLKSVLCALFFIPAAAQAEDWITEEVLKQLSEVRQELKNLQSEIKELKEIIKKQPVAQPSRAANNVNKELSIADTPFLGDNKAKIVVVEFSDYQCPYCRRHFKQTMPELRKNYIETGKIQYHMKQFPLAFHSKAKGASVAALCMGKQNESAYWQAHESIFNGETSLERDAYLQMARNLKLDITEYKNCLNDKTVASRVDREFFEGESVGVSGTPAFLIGKLQGDKVVQARLLAGARPYASFVRVIDQLLN